MELSTIDTLRTLHADAMNKAAIRRQQGHLQSVAMWLNQAAKLRRNIAWELEVERSEEAWENRPLLCGQDD